MKLIANPKALTTWNKALDLAEQLAEDCQMSYLPGSIVHYDHLLEMALDDLEKGNLVQAAAMILVLGDLGNILQGDKPRIT